MPDASNNHYQSLLQLTDCHLFSDPEKMAYGVNPLKSLNALLAQVAAIQPDALIVTGDISADDSKHSYQLFLESIHQYGLADKLKVIAGNHDQSPWFAHYMAGFDLTFQAPLNLGNWQIHGIDTRHKGTLGYLHPSDLQQLLNNIDSQPQYYHMIACHHNPIQTGSWMDKHEWLNRQSFLDAIANRENIRTVIYGHIHSDTTHIFENCLLQSCPSSCWQFALCEEFKVADEQPGMRHILLGDEGQLQSQIYRVS
ncbi:metallophosphoesterase [Aliiglaciecola sp. LCG003]|uniref:metallophosphoesterase family protein n=1 Tax=Aliiglaciecola sp. LCG003 TaxID=3053655 RepID=UPI002572E2F3|nr:metallophosphoesterase [Aliiglaciecola sp. LCG003]WJG08935.1 metallophosphoesterase [Aliiglaciecola sp. LCG003]